MANPERKLASPPVTSASATTKLTPRQLEIVALATAGLSNKQIAQKLLLTEGTVKQHLHSAFARLGIKRRLSLLIERVPLAEVENQSKASSPTGR